MARVRPGAYSSGPMPWGTKARLYLQAEIISRSIYARWIKFESVLLKLFSGMSLPIDPASFPPGFLEESRVPQIVAGNATVQILGTLLFFARVYSRLVLIGLWKSEDWALLFSWLLATAYSICQYGQVFHGSGRHLFAIASKNDAVISQKYAYAAQVFLVLAIPMPKVSMCLAYLRIFYSDVNGRRLIYGLLTVLFTTMIAFEVENFFTCQPLDLYWKELRPPDKCLDDIVVLYLHGGINLAVDLVLMGILIPRILALKLNKRQKWVLIGIVLTGSFAVVAGLVRLIRVGTVLSQKYSASKPLDAPWEMYDVSIWSATEIYVALMCAAAPGVKPLVSRVLPKLLGTTLYSRSWGASGPSKAVELSSKANRSGFGTRSSTMLKSSKVSTLMAAHGPYAEIHTPSTTKYDEESLYRRDMDDGLEPVHLDQGITRNTRVDIRIEPK